jgi:hypothetical protein
MKTARPRSTSYERSADACIIDGRDQISHEKGQMYILSKRHRHRHSALVYLKTGSLIHGFISTTAELPTRYPSTLPAIFSPCGREANWALRSLVPGSVQKRKVVKGSDMLASRFCSLPVTFWRTNTGRRLTGVPKAEPHRQHLRTFQKTISEVKKARTHQHQSSTSRSKRRKKLTSKALY